MPLLGSAAMLLSFDVVAEAIAEHDHWHTFEHLPERLSIPGFLRGTRWIATRGGPRYLVLYEVAQVATLTSDAYRERLDHPTAWTTKMMPHYRGMTRGFCSVNGSFGFGLGGFATLFRFEPAAEASASLRRWLCDDVLVRIPGEAGLGSAHLLESAVVPQMTNEQRIRGADARVDWALLVTGYDERAVASLGVDADALETRGAADIVQGVYRFDYALTHDEVDR